MGLGSALKQMRRSILMGPPGVRKPEEQVVDEIDDLLTPDGWSDALRAKSAEAEAEPEMQPPDPPESEEEIEEEDDEESPAVGDVSPIDLTSRPEDWDPFHHRVEVPLMPFEMDEVKQHCQAWKREEPSNELPHQVLRAMHELEEFRSADAAERMAALGGSTLQMQVTLLESENQRLKEELEQTKKVMAAQQKLNEMMTSTAIDEKVLGARVDKLDVGDLFGMTAKLPEERDDP